MTTQERTPQRRASTPHLIKTAHVGWTGSTMDSRRLSAVTAMETKTRDHPHRVTTNIVKFDLSYDGTPDPRFGADFLTDQRTFDIVVLHWIFEGWGNDRIPEIGKHFAFSLSPAHQPENWRKRLRRSQARRIYVFGSGTEVSGAWLGDLPGYSKTYGDSCTIYSTTKTRL